MEKKTVVVGFSGGKDSTTAIMLLKKQGYDVRALTMLLGLDGEQEKINKIENLARRLQVPLKTVDMAAVFREKVIGYFNRAYAQGLTPNPCVMCNNEIKFNLLLQYALEFERADYYATGHYADKVEIHGDYFLKDPVDRVKSQIYFLSMIGKERLAKTLFPLAGMTVEEVREGVKDLTLGNQKESQDVCFLQGWRLIDYLKEHIPQAFTPGDILDVDGKVMGTHQGAVNFTIGQRRGTKFSSSGKLYVVKKDIPNNTITLGENCHLFSGLLKVTDPVYWTELKPGDELNVKVRYVGGFVKARIEEAGPDHILARFHEPVRAVTPGQIGAFYRDQIIVAAGYIALDL